MHAPDLTMNVEYVRKLLDERDWTWSDLANAMSMSKSTLSRVVKYRTLPGRQFIFALQGIFPDHGAELFAPVPERWWRCACGHFEWFDVDPCSECNEPRPAVELEDAA